MSAQIIPFPAMNRAAVPNQDTERVERIRRFCEDDGYHMSNGLAERIAEVFRLALLEATPVRR